MISVKRVYEPAAASDGTRFLVDHLWPRGLKKEDVKELDQDCVTEQRAAALVWT